MLNLTLWGKVAVKILVATQFNYTLMVIPVIISNVYWKQCNGLGKKNGIVRSKELDEGS